VAGHCLDPLRRTLPGHGGVRPTSASLASVGHFCIGLGLIAWIVLEATWIVVSPPLQILMGSVGVAILILAVEDMTRGSRL
jgi:hypothetical protein